MLREWERPLVRCLGIGAEGAKGRTRAIGLRAARDVPTPMAVLVFVIELLSLVHRSALLLLLRLLRRGIGPACCRQQESICHAACVHLAQAMVGYGWRSNVRAGASTSIGCASLTFRLHLV